MHRKLIPLASLLIAGFLTPTSAQIYIMNGSPITDCNGTFFDPGGGNGNYANSLNLVTTLCSDGSAGTHVRLDFSGIDVANGDVLCFHDGPDITAPILSCSNQYQPGSPVVVQATAVNPSGCLTLEFSSDASGTATGWSGIISCRPSCQTIIADLVSTLPASIPPDTGWIDICPGERVFFSGIGLYPQNGFAYQQSDLTTTFEWSFGDGGIAYGPDVSHTFNDPGGYYVQLMLTDTQGCESTNLINQRIRVAPRPDFILGSPFDQIICAGDSIQLGASTDSLQWQNLLVSPNSGTFTTGGSRSDSLALPDGNGEPYETSIYFTQFSPGQVLTDANDLLSVCVNMEHSWMRDLRIELTCPNGQSIELHNFGGQVGSQVYLGIPNDGDVFNPVPGTGWDYCWTSTAGNPTWLVYANTFLNSGGTLPSGDYSPYDPFDNLLGCPLNGEWTITVTDLWAIDNGYIFSWGIDFDPALYPSLEIFRPDFVDWEWNFHPSIYFETPNSIAASPVNAGTAGYVFTVHDDFGCSWDTLLSITVLPHTHPSCFNCTENYNALKDSSVCLGETVQLNATFTGQTLAEVRFEAYPDYALGAANHPPANPYFSGIAVNSLGFATLADPATQITSICVDIETDFDADLNIALQSPDGKQIDLSSGNGGAGDNYKITCFSPTATIPVAGSPAPFNGTFLPEGSWSNLNNSQVNGAWKLVVSDAFGINQYGRVKWWSIGFNTTNSVTFDWGIVPTLSCSACPDPLATPDSTRTYQVTAVDSYNCIHRDTVTIVVSNSLEAPAGLSFTNMAGGNMAWTWNPVAGANGYEVNVNNGGWMPANGSGTHTVTGLSNGDGVNIEVRAAGGDPDCPIQSATAGANYAICTIAIQLDNTAPVLCAGQSNGSATASASGTTGPVEFLADGISTGNFSGIFNGIFNAGQHFIIALDTAGCRDTVYFTITEPAALTVDARAHQVICNGGNTGSVAADASGGTAPYTFVWQPCAGGPLMPGDSVPNLTAGCYGITVTDANGCTVTDTVHVVQPLPMQFSGVQDSVSCFGGSDGTATITVTGGVSPFTYVWDNGSTGQTATGLNAVFHSVTVEDAIGCQKVTIVQVLEPTAIQIDSIVVTNTVCVGSADGALKAYVHGGTLPYQYSWSNNMSGQMISGIPAGTYTLTVTDGNACTLTTTAVVGAPPALTASLVPTPVTCFGGSDGTITAQASGGTPAYTYTWSVPQSGPTITGLSAGTYSLTLTDSKGCTLTGLNTTVAGPAQQIQVSVDTSQMPCAGGSNGSMTVSASGGNGAPFTFSWSNGQTGPTVSGLPAGTVQVTATDQLNCSLQVDLNLIALQPVQVSVAFNLPTCFNASDGEAGVNQINGGAGNDIPGNYTYNWSVPNSPDTLFVTGLTGGQTYTVTATDNQGCSGTASFTMGQPPALDFNLIIKNVSCTGLSDGSVQVGSIPNGQTVTGYQWSTGETTNAIAGLAGGNYSVTLTDDMGCTGSQTFAILVPEPLDIVLNPTPLTCNSSTNGAIQSAVQGGTPAYQYDWSNGGTTSSVSMLTPGTYTLTVTDANGCIATDSVSLADPVPLLVSANVINARCSYSADGRIEVIVTGGQPAYQYSLNGGNYKSTSVFFGLQAGSYHISVKDVNGCIGESDFTVLAPPLLSVTLGPDTTILFGEAVELQSAVINGLDPLRWQWSSSLVDTFVCVDTPDCANVLVMPAYTNTFKVVVTDANGCRAEAVQTVRVEKPRGVFVPTGFSPNADINNDRLIVYGKSDMVETIMTFRVYDRWGELVYEDLNFAVNNEARGWDGRFRGKDCDPGVYVWMLEVMYRDGYTDLLYGNTTLIR